MLQLSEELSQELLEAAEMSALTVGIDAPAAEDLKYFRLRQSEVH